MYSISLLLLRETTRTHRDAQAWGFEQDFSLKEEAKSRWNNLRDRDRLLFTSPSLKTRRSTLAEEINKLPRAQIKRFVRARSTKKALFRGRRSSESDKFLRSAYCCKVVLEGEVETRFRFKKTGPCNGPHSAGPSRNKFDSPALPLSGMDQSVR